MRQKIAELTSDRYPPEKPKFRSPLLLVHGLWTGSWSWNTWATHFCNLGWDCLAINFKGRAGESSIEDLKRLRFDDCVADLGRVLGALSFPPVVLAMNLGALSALKAAETNELSAIILVSPSPPANLGIVRSRPSRLLQMKYAPLIFLRRPFRIEEKDLRLNFLNTLPENLQHHISRQTGAESTLLVQEFLSPSVTIESASITCPTLILGGTEDRITPVSASRELAQWLGSDLNEVAGQGHWLIETDGETVVRDIHRWIIQKLGDRILLADNPQ